MKDFSLYSDEDLIREIKADNMVAFDVFYKKYSKKLYKFGFSIIKSQEDTENLIQDVFLILWENRHRIEKDSSIKSYLFSIAYNSAITIIRKKIKESEFLDYLKSIQEINDESVNVELEYNELTNKLGEIINVLPKRQKEVYLLMNLWSLLFQPV